MDNSKAVMLNQTNKSLFFDMELFKHAHQVADLLSNSNLVPEHFRGNLCDCMVALNFAYSNNIDPFMALQKLYVIKGKPGIEAQLKIALFQQKSTRYGTLRYELSGKGASRTCTAYAIENDTGEAVYGPPISMELAEKEGWLSKSGSKWKTMPDKMLMYRAASWFIDTYDPGVVMGMATIEELQDSIDITPDAPPDVSAANSRPLEALESPPQEISKETEQATTDKAAKQPDNSAGDKPANSKPEQPQWFK